MSSRKSYAALTIGFAVVWVTLLVVAIVSSRRSLELRLSAGQPGGVYQPVAEAVRDLVASEDADLVIEVLASDGSAENARRLQDGGTELALLQNDTPGNEMLRSLVPLQAGALHFLVRRESGIRDIADLVGHRVGVGLPTSGSHRLVEELLKHFEVDPGAIELRPLTIEEACRQLDAGELDALLMMIGMKTEAVERLTADGEVGFVPIGSHAGPGSVLAGFRLTNPFVEATLIPKYCYAMPHDGRPGVPEQAVPALAVRTVLVARRDLPNRAAREITRIVIENRNRLARMHPNASLLDGGLEPGGLQFPLHPGASQYYNRNQPGFLVRYAEVIGLLVSLAFSAYGLIKAGRRWFLQRRKDRIDAYYSELNRLLDHLLEPRSEEEIREVEVQLQRIRSTALRLLSKERLLPDESFRIFQTVLAEAGAQARAKRQELQLGIKPPA